MLLPGGIIKPRNIHNKFAAAGKKPLVISVAKIAGAAAALAE
jgi:hypothetical protein